MLEYDEIDEALWEEFYDFLNTGTYDYTNVKVGDTVMPRGETGEYFNENVNVMEPVNGSLIIDEEL